MCNVFTVDVNITGKFSHFIHSVPVSVKFGNLK